MSRAIHILSLLLCISLGVKVRAQSDTLRPGPVWKKMALNGYLKDMNIIAIPALNGNWNFDHLVHNRLNYRWDISKPFSVQVEARNRLFFGESAKNDPDFGNLIDQNLDHFKLGGIVVRERSFILHTVIDRANLSFTKGKWQAIVGKQRINWSQSYVWNPNDIFNAYSFFDFDYEERRGSDAVFIAYETGPLSSVQMASSIHDDWNSTIMAAYYRFNKWNYDFQVLGGKYQHDLYVGVGWAGRIKTIGFNGELSYFDPYKTSANGTFIGDLSFDYRFLNTLNFRFETIFNSQPTDSAPGVFFLEPVTAKTLTYNHWSAFAAVGYEITPLLTVNVNGIWNIDDRSWFINPNVNVSLNKNSELLIALQTFGGSPGSLYQGFGSYLYTRLKFNF